MAPYFLIQISVSSFDLFYKLCSPYLSTQPAVYKFQVSSCLALTGGHLLRSVTLVTFERVIQLTS